MKSDTNVLVIAEDAVLRRSLAFLLEAEGFDVTSRQTVPGMAEHHATRARCAVVDDDSLEGPETWLRLAANAETVVLLLARPRQLPADLPVATVDKPLLGALVVDAVKSLLRLNPPTT